MYIVNIVVKRSYRLKLKIVKHLSYIGLYKLVRIIAQLFVTFKIVAHNLVDIKHERILTQHITE